MPSGRRRAPAPMRYCLDSYLLLSPRLRTEKHLLDLGVKAQYPLCQWRLDGPPADSSQLTSRQQEAHRNLEQATGNIGCMEIQCGGAEYKGKTAAANNPPEPRSWPEPTKECGDHDHRCAQA